MTTTNEINETLGCDPEKAFGEKLIAYIQHVRRSVADVFSDDNEDMEPLTLILALHLKTALLQMEASVALIQALQERLAKAEARLASMVRASRPGPEPGGVPMEDLPRWFDENCVEVQVPNEHLSLLREIFRDVPHIIVMDDGEGQRGS